MKNFQLFIIYILLLFIQTGLHPKDYSYPKDIKKNWDKIEWMEIKGYKIFKAWVDLLEGCMHEEFLLEEMSLIKNDEMLVLISGEEVETRRLPDNVVQFKSKMWQHDCPVNGKTSLNPGSICDWCGAEE